MPALLAVLHVETQSSGRASGLASCAGVAGCHFLNDSLLRCHNISILIGELEVEGPESLDSGLCEHLGVMNDLTLVLAANKDVDIVHMYRYGARGPK
jgi:hypothetical protein